MTIELDPFVKRMRDAETDAERAVVLLEAPVLTLLRWAGVFDHHCRRAAFDEGSDYLAALRETLGRQRHRGEFSGVVLTAATTTLLGVLERGGNDG